MSWQALVTDARTRAAIVTTIQRLVSELESLIAEHAQRGDALCDAWLDDALLRSQLASDGVVEDTVGRATTSLVRAIETDALVHGRAISLFGGQARIAWTVAHLTSGPDAEAVCDSIEAALVRSLQQTPAHFDLISGIAGVGVMAVERGAAGATLAAHVVGHLERLARPVRGGLAWWTPVEWVPEHQRPDAPNGYWNLGIAHGTPGVIAVLAMLIRAELEVVRATRLLDAAVDYLLAAEPPSPNRFPNWHPTPPNLTHQVAWCYGDLGVSIALMAAARARHHEGWYHDALALAREMATRAVEDSGVVDPWLCHGAAGAAHLFNRLYHATGDQALRSAAERWLVHTLAMCDGSVPQRGRVHEEPRPDLLRGPSGIALALHAAISNVEPAWDRVLGVGT